MGHCKDKHLKLQLWGYDFPLLSKKILSLKPNYLYFNGGLLAILLLNIVTNPSNLCAKIPEMFKIICVLRWQLGENY